MATQNPKSSGTTKGTAAKSTSRKTPAKPKAKSAKDVCFVIQPFGGWNDEYHTEIFCKAIEGAGLEPKRADDLFRSSNIVHDIWHLVTTSRLLLADLTGKNPNVFYELGLAHAARKPVLLVTQSIDDVPFDLRALRIITYDVEHPAWGQLLRANITNGLKETLESPERSVLPTFLTQEPTDGVPTMSADELRILDLEQQISSLRSEVRSPVVRRERLSPDEAEALVARYLGEGVPPDLIVERVSRRGAPRGWVRDYIQSLTGEAPRV